jgi:hypothetical protein
MAVGTCPPHVDEPQQEREHRTAPLVHGLPSDIFHIVSVYYADHEAENPAPFGAKVVPVRKDVGFSCYAASNGPCDDKGDACSSACPFSQPDF